MTGRITRIYHDKGYGFIKGSDGKDYFMHRTSVKNADWASLEEGQDVTFEDAEGQKGPRAEDVYV